jgi:hypothetical protein
MTRPRPPRGCRDIGEKNSASYAVRSDYTFFMIPAYVSLYSSAVMISTFEENPSLEVAEYQHVC